MNDTEIISTGSNYHCYINNSIFLDRLEVFNDSIKIYNLSSAGKFENNNDTYSSVISFFNNTKPYDDLKWDNGTIINDLSTINITAPILRYFEFGDYENPIISTNIINMQEFELIFGSGYKTIGLYYSVEEEAPDTLLYNVTAPNGTIINNGINKSYSNQTIYINIVDKGTYVWDIYANDTSGNFQQYQVRFQLAIIKGGGGAVYNEPEIIVINQTIINQTTIEIPIVKDINKLKDFFKDRNNLIILGFSGLLICIALFKRNKRKRIKETCSIFDAMEKEK